MIRCDVYLDLGDGSTFALSFYADPLLCTERAAARFSASVRSVWIESVAEILESVR